MDMKKKIGLGLAWVVSMVVATTVATTCVAQQLVPPPPVISANPQDVLAIENRLKEIDKKLDRIGMIASACKRLSMAIYTKMFPLQMEQRAQEFSGDPD